MPWCHVRRSVALSSCIKSSAWGNARLIKTTGEINIIHRWDYAHRAKNTRKFGASISSQLLTLRFAALWPDPAGPQHDRRQRTPAGAGSSRLGDKRLKTRRTILVAANAVAIATLCLSGCSGRSGGRLPMAATTDERECLVRAMYFESNRSSYDGSMAVGTVVMNRVESERFPSTICGVVGQHKQFAPGVLTKKMDPKQMKPALHAADAVLKGGTTCKSGPSHAFSCGQLQEPLPSQIRHGRRRKRVLP